MEEVAQARTVRIGPAHECGIFEADGFVYATILGEGVPSRSRPSAAGCETKAKGNLVSTKQASGVRDEGDSLGIFRDQTDYGVVSSDKHEPPLRNLRERKGVV